MSMLTEIQQEDILRAFKASIGIEWCSGVVSWPSATLPLFYKTRHGRHNPDDADSPKPIGKGKDDNTEPKVG